MHPIPDGARHPVDARPATAAARPSASGARHAVEGAEIAPLPPLRLGVSLFHPPGTAHVTYTAAHRHCPQGIGVKRPAPGSPPIATPHCITPADFPAHLFATTPPPQASILHMVLPPPSCGDYHSGALDPSPPAAFGVQPPHLSGTPTAAPRSLSGRVGAPPADLEDQPRKYQRLSGTGDRG